MKHKIVSDDDLQKIAEWSAVKGTKLLFYHNDPDGICSAALWMRCFHDFEPVAREGPVMQQGFVQWISDQDPDVLVFLDLPVDQEWKKIRWLEKQNPDLKIIVIDHHIPDRNLNSGQVSHINNKFMPSLKEKYLPASCLVYSILESVGEKKQIRKMKWIAAAGIAGDYGEKDCAEFFRGMKDKIKKIENAADLISAAVTLKGRQGADRALKIMLRVENVDDLIARKTLNIWKRFVDVEVTKVVDEYEKEKEEFPEINLVMFHVRSRMNIVSVVSTLLSEKYPEKIIIIRKLSHKGLWKVSARLQAGKLDIGTLFKKCVKGIGSGGGHKQAAGARVKDWEKFKRRLISELEVSV